MKLRRFYFAIITVLAVFFISCLGTKNDDTELPSNANFVSLTFSKNDSIPELEKAKFTLEGIDNGDSIIVNLDSLPFQTRIDSVFPKFSFRSTSATILYQETESGIDTIYLTGKDTIDFSLPTKVENYSADGTNSRIYQIVVNVHQVEPELYVWQKLNDNITTRLGINQKAVFYKNRYLFYTGSETNNRLYISDGRVIPADGNWVEIPIALPAENRTTLRLQYMIEHKDTLFVTDNENKLYYSVNGETWNNKAYTSDKVVHNLLFSLDNQLWAIMKSAENIYYISSSADGEIWSEGEIIPDGFPVSDYAALVFKSSVGRHKAIVLGGYNNGGLLEQANFSTENGSYWVKLRNNQIGAIQNASVIQYDSKLLLFGGMNNKREMATLYESKNQGLDWSIPDSTYNVLPQDFTPRAYQSVILDDINKRIYIIGGKDNSISYSDVWTTKLNRMAF